jgi:hypothetical protein
MAGKSRRPKLVLNGGATATTKIHRAVGQAPAREVLRSRIPIRYYAGGVGGSDRPRSKNNRLSRAVLQVLDLPEGIAVSHAAGVLLAKALEPGINESIEMILQCRM